MGEIRHTFRARRDLIDLWLLIHEANPAAADRHLQRIEARIEILKHFPEAGQRRRDIAPDARVLVEPPYLILYRLIPGGVQIVRVLHGAKRISRAVFLAGFE
ncbi:MAG: type II toxin-antitoxin system RelE/ParE family toxin [Stellaceae bacterium]